MQRFPILCLAVLLAAACGDGDRAADPTEAETLADDTARSAAYSERLLFLAGTERAPVAVVLDFSARVDSSTLYRVGRAWRAEGERLTTLLDTAWTMAAMRDPWRLVPHGPIRFSVDRDGELETLRYRGADDGFRLLAGAVVGEWSPDADAQLLLRRGEMLGGDGSMPGALLELRLGRDSVLSSGDGRAAEAYLTDGRGAYVVVLDHAPDGRRRAWLRRGTLQDAWTDVRLEAVEVRPAPADTEPQASAAGNGAVRFEGVPTAWRLASPGDSLTGELRLIGASPGAATSAGVFTVRGWVEAAGDRQPVFGVVRHGAE